MPSLLSPVSVAQSAAWNRRLNPLFNAAGPGVGHGDFSSNQEVGAAQQALLQRLIKPLEGGHWLQLSCGTGGACTAILEKAEQLTGTDPDQKQIEQARRAHSRPSFVVSDTERLPFAKETFDNLVSIQGMSHARDLGHALHQAWTVLKPGGWMALADFATQPRHYQLADRAKMRWIAGSLGGLRLQPVERWQGHMAHMGMENIQVVDLTAGMAKGLDIWADALVAASGDLRQRGSAQMIARSYRSLAKAGAGGPLRYVGMWGRKA
ncbi:MAG: ubiquinone/menaquinone biosynthesis C-methylase UbiE [Cognaticolwellia sp.]|jgi:ubiquinone/menaquinone biosynthesis C-methylase UbiE